MARDEYDDKSNLVRVGNPEWYGKILVQQFHANGKSKGWSLSSTRQTRDAALHYLVKVAQVDFEEEEEEEERCGLSSQTAPISSKRGGAVMAPPYLLNVGLL
jgi:hypothetical protein